MAVTPNSLVSVQTPKRGFIQIINTDGTGNKTVWTAGTNGSKVVALIASSLEAAATRDVTVSTSNGTTAISLGTVTIPINAGNIPTVGAIDLLGLMVGLPIDNDGQRYIFLSGTEILVVKSAVAVTTSLSFVAFGGDF